MINFLYVRQITWKRNECDVSGTLAIPVSKPTRPREMAMVQAIIYLVSLKTNEKPIIIICEGLCMAVHNAFVTCVVTSDVGLIKICHRHLPTVLSTSSNWLPDRLPIGGWWMTNEWRNLMHLLWVFPKDIVTFAEMWFRLFIIVIIIDGVGCCDNATIYFYPFFAQIDLTMEHMHTFPNRHIDFVWRV